MLSVALRCCGPVRRGPVPKAYHTPDGAVHKLRYPYSGGRGGVYIGIGKTLENM